MLGDLLRLIPSGARPVARSPTSWPPRSPPGRARRPACSPIPAPGAGRRAQRPNPDPLERIRFEELSTIAELHVTDATGMTMRLSAGRSGSFQRTRSEWARRTLDTWRPVLDRMAEVLGPPGAPGRPAGRAGQPAQAAPAARRGTGNPDRARRLERLEDLESLRDLDDLENRRDLTAGEGLHPSLGDRQPGAGDIDADPREAGRGGFVHEMGRRAMFPTMIAMQVSVSVVGHLAERRSGRTRSRWPR